MMHLLMGVKKESDGMRMLRLILARYGRYDDYRVSYCYWETPPSTVKERAGLLEEARTRLEGIWLEQPGIIVGLGWMACELLTGKGKTKLKTRVGTKWNYIGDITRQTWITYDPEAILFDPALTVDIAAVLVAAGKEEGHLMQVFKNEAIDNMNKIWKRYL